MADPNRWDASGNIVGDIREAVMALRDAPSLTRVEVTQLTLDALRTCQSTAQRDQIVRGVGCLTDPYGGVPIFVTDDLPDGKARVCWSNGDEQVIP